MSARPSSVLYDAPGPKAVRRARIASVVAVLVLLGLAVLAVRRLADQGEFSPERWAPLLWPSDETFGDVWQLILRGLRTTALAALVTIALSLVLGTLITAVRLSVGRVARFPLVLLVEVLRGSPVVILIFIAARVLPTVGIDLPLFWYLVIGLTAYNFVVIAEIVRAGVLAVPRGQVEAGLAVGLRRSQVMSRIQLPQAFRLMLPALISQLVVIVKDTSLAGLVLSGPAELLRAGRTIEQFLDNTLQTYLVIAVIYIVVNSLLSALAVTVERRLAGRAAGRRGRARVEPAGVST